MVYTQGPRRCCVRACDASGVVVLRHDRAMKYMNKSFTVGSTDNESAARYAKNWDKVFGKAWRMPDSTDPRQLAFGLESSMEHWPEVSGPVDPADLQKREGK